MRSSECFRSSWRPPRFRLVILHPQTPTRETLRQKWFSVYRDSSGSGVTCWLFNMIALSSMASKHTIQAYNLQNEGSEGAIILKLQWQCSHLRSHLRCHLRSLGTKWQTKISKFRGLKTWPKRAISHQNIRFEKIVGLWGEMFQQQCMWDFRWQWIETCHQR